MPSAFVTMVPPAFLPKVMLSPHATAATPVWRSSTTSGLQMRPLCCAPPCVMSAPVRSTDPVRP